MRYLFTIFIQLSILLSFSSISFANITLPAIFTDHMVLQRNTTVKIWGWGKPLEAVTLEVGWAKEVFVDTIDNQGQWELLVPTPEAGGPYTIRIKGHNEIELADVLIGEVWLCTGQSNMEWSANSGIEGAEAAIAAANHPRIRFFSVAHRTANDPQIDLKGDWEVCTPQTMADFSAVAYFFARKLQQKLAVPIGLIDASWGGTPAETWMPAEVIEGNELLAKAAAELTAVPWGPHQPARGYNAMIAPLTSFKIAGNIWYQGESNTGNAHAYKDMFTALIQSWRGRWGYDFPFYFVQIAPFGYGVPMQGVEIRDAQRRTLEVPNTGMVVTSDIGNTKDIHPKNKLDVGLRLAGLALAKHYEVSDAVVEGPLYKSMQVEGEQVHVFFYHALGLHAKGGALASFELAGKNGKYCPAKATIVDGHVIVQAEKVKQPVTVRFAWSNTAEPNLFNEAGLPASSFSSQ